MLLNVSYYLLQTLLMLTTLANPFVCGLQRIRDIVLTPDSCVLFVHQFEDGKQSTISSGYPTSCLAPWSILQQTVVPCPTPHSLVSHVTFTHCFERVLPTLLPSFLPSLLQSASSWITYHRLPKLHLFLLSPVT